MEKIKKLKQKSNANLDSVKWVVDTFTKANDSELYEILYNYCFSNRDKEKIKKLYKNLLT